MTGPPTALLFDAAGTLIHPAESVGVTYARHFAGIGVTVSPEETERAFRAVFHSASSPQYPRHDSGHAAERAWWAALVQRVWQEVDSSLPEEEGCHPEGFTSLFDALFRYYSEPSAWRLYPDVLSCLEEAAGWGPLAVVSNFDDRLGPILDGLGIAPFFAQIVTSADARVRKPERAIFDLVLGGLGCSPHQAAHCGDSRIADVEGAQAAGLRAFHLRRPTNSLLEFLEFCRS